MVVAAATSGGGIDVVDPGDELGEVQLDTTQPPNAMHHTDHLNGLDATNGS